MLHSTKKARLDTEPGLFIGVAACGWLLHIASHCGRSDRYNRELQRSDPSTQTAFDVSRQNKGGGTVECSDPVGTAPGSVLIIGPRPTILLRYNGRTITLSAMVTAIPPLKESEKVEFGDPQSGKQSARRDTGNVSTIVVASYNIRYAVGRFLIAGGLLRKAGLRRPGQRQEIVARNIARAARAFAEGHLLPRVDVLALQEADKKTTRAGRHHVTRELAEALQMSWIHMPAGIPRGVKPVTRQWWLDFEEQIGLYDTGDTGVGLLSRLPLSNVIRIDLPWQECAWRPRLAMAATVPVGASTVRIFNAHVDPHAAVGGQLEQLEVLVGQADKESGPTLILGDFNTLSKKKVSQTRSFLESRGYSTPFTSGTPTWRGMGIRLHADWIFYRKVKIVRFGVARPLSVSDHWPIWAEVEVA